MKELKNIQHELIDNVALIYDLKDEIYKDINIIKTILSQYYNQIQILRKQINECQETRINDKNIKDNSVIDIKDNEIVKEINLKIKRLDDKLDFIEKNVPSNTDIKNLNEKIEKTEKYFKISNKQIEEKLYDKIRVRQKEIVEGFSNQDKKIAMIDENFKRKMKDLDEKSNKCNDNCTSINRRINELTESVTKLKNEDNTEEIKKLSEMIKENKESIKNKTNVLYEKINNVDTHNEKLNNEIIEMKKENNKSINDIKEIQNKNKEIESSFKDISNIILDVDNRYEALKEQSESNVMSISIIENKINSLDNNLKNYDLEKINNIVNILKKENDNVVKEYLPKYKNATDQKFTDYETKFSAKIGDVYKAINKYSQKVDDASSKYDEKMRYIRNTFKGELKEEILKDVENAQEKYWENINEIFQDLVRKINEKWKTIFSEISALQKKSDDVPPSLRQHIEKEINKLKALISATTTIPIIKDDPNYISLQTFLAEILEKHNKKFEQTWKEEFYKCVEMLNKNINTSV
eukprot:jgi/Orpsp1_1/1184776/evm.model.c7180000090942.1